MKRVLTAIGNSRLNDKLREMENYQILAEDISTDEELIEWIERVGEVDILFLCSHIIQNYDVDELIEIVKKIQENILIVFFKDGNSQSGVEEKDNLKVYNTLNCDLDIFEKLLQKEVKKDTKKNMCRTISITGASGVGKSTFSTFLARNVENKNVKTLLMDFDIEENQIRTILKIKKQPQYNENIENMIVHISKNLDVLCHLDFIFTNKNEINYFKIQEIINQLKEKYNLIIIDTSSRIENEFTKRIFYNSNNIIFLLEPNILGIKKSKNMLEVFENDWKISNEKIKMILNKTNIYQISESIIEEIFPDIKLLGKMKYLDSYNLMINKNIDKKEIKKEYEKIYKKFC